MITSKKVLFLIAIIANVLLLASTNPAQQRQPDRGIQSGNAYSISDIETINNTNGNLMLNIPLASLPAGRGTSPGFSLSLVYNSKLYDKKRENKDDGQPVQPGNTNYHRELLTQTDAGGWRLSIGHSLKLTSRFETETQHPCDGSYYLQKNTHIYKLRLVLPDGTETEFRPIGYTDTYGDGYFNVSPFGVQSVMGYSTVGGGSASCNLVNTTTSPNGMSYSADDASGARLFIPNQPQAAVETLRWTLYYPDGRTIERLPPDDPTVGERITDRNNNKVVIKSDTFNGASATKIVDDVGHFIIIQGDNIYSQGIGEELLQTVINKKTQYVYRNYKTVYFDDPDRDPNEANPNQDQIYANIIANWSAVESITLPSQAGSLKYEFTYYAQETEPSGSNYTQGWGELKSVTLPSGAKAEYQYLQPTDNTTDEVLKSYVTDKTLTYKENYEGTLTTRTQTWHYALTNTSATITAPDGSATTQFFKSTWATPSWDSGLVYATSLPDGTVVNKNWLSKYLVEAEFKTLPNGLTAVKSYSYDLNNNVTNIKEYEFCSAGSLTRDSNSKIPIPACSALKRETINEYYNPHVSNYDSTPKLKGLLKSTEIRSGNGIVMSRSEIYYDDQNNTGNPTETKVWDSTKPAGLPNTATNGYKLDSSNSISTTAQYDQYGNPVSTTDAKEVTTTITYGCINGQASCAATEKNLYPTKTETASNYASLKRTSQIEYDFSTGLPTASIDVENNLRSETVYDALGRKKIQKVGVGTALEAWTQFDYYVSPTSQAASSDWKNYVVTKSDVFVKQDAKKVSTQFFDQLGRVRLTKSLEDATSQSATNETDGIKVQNRYLTSSGYTYQLTSNPYRATTPALAASDPAMGWTRTKTSSNGRHSETETFSGADLPAPFAASNANTASTGVVMTDIDSDRIMVTDQAGKKRISKTNALGQLINVWEIKEQDNDTETITFGNPAQTLYGLKTSYSYETLGNLTNVAQGNQPQRSFSYSSLSRLLSASNPESGTISYEYDENGNLTKKTDARLVVTNYSYDKLNRLQTRTYSAPSGLQYYQAALPATYEYDGVANAKGKLTKVITGNTFSVTEYQSFDALGRVTQSQQKTDGTNPAPMTYTYNLAGALIEQKYPSGRVVKNELDVDGDLKTVQSKKNQTSGYWTYAQRFSYTAAGAVSSMQLGNGTWESTAFNSRMQPTQIALGKTQAATDLLKLNYTYQTPNVADNNGNVKTQIITVPNSAGQTNGFTATQTYNYDGLNRLKDATETINSGQTWKQTYKYDRFGNRTFDEANTSTLPKNCTDSNNAPAVCPNIVPIVNPAANTSDNRLQNYEYDASGNMTKDLGNLTADPNKRRYTYDGENKQTKVERLDSSGSTPIGTIGEYFYDADGRRVKKKDVGTGETTIFVYDASGKMVAEYSTDVATGSNAKIGYLTNDTLGSPRIITDRNGNVTSRRDFLPFGEEINATVGGRSGVQGYGGDSTRQKFTGKQRDSESGLDYFEARYYSSAFGRFVSADYFEGNPVDLINSYEKSSALPYATLLNPQSLNLYIYVQNNPLSQIDPDGHQGREPLPGNNQYEIRLDLDNPNDSPNIHVFRRGQRQHVGRIAVKGTAEAPIYEWKDFGRGTPASVKALVENVIRERGITPRPPIFRPRPTRGGRRGGGAVNNAFAYLGLVEILTYAIEQNSNKQHYGFYYGIDGRTIFLTDLAKASQNLPQNQVYTFEGRDFLLKGGVFIGISPGCKGCTLKQNNDEKIYIDDSECRDCKAE